MKHELCQGDNQVWLDQIRVGTKINMVFADPPDNIGLDYEQYEDNLPDDEYIELLEKWTRSFIAKADTVWMSFNSRWLLDMAVIVDRILKEDDSIDFKPCVQTFSFYQYNKNDLGNSHRPLWRLRNAKAGHYPEQAKVKSWRQMYGDKRAAEGGKLPGDAFDFSKLATKQRRNWHDWAIQVGAYVTDLLIPDDHFDFPRVVGNSKQRRSWHKTQLNEGLVERCILLSTKPGDLVVDPFGGTGTTLRVCKKLDRACTLIELDETYCQEIAKEHGMVVRETGKYSKWELGL